MTLAPIAFFARVRANLLRACEDGKDSMTYRRYRGLLRVILRAKTIEDLDRPLLVLAEMALGHAMAREEECT